MSDQDHPDLGELPKDLNAVRQHSEEAIKEAEQKVTPVRRIRLDHIAPWRCRCPATATKKLRAGQQRRSGFRGSGLCMKSWMGCNGPEHTSWLAARRLERSYSSKPAERMAREPQTRGRIDDVA
jgi:hypothetical protein